MKWLLGASLLYSITMQAQDVVTLSIEDALKEGLEHSRELKASRSAQESAEARAAEVNTNLLPQLKMEASYRRLSEVDPFQVTLPTSQNSFVLSPSIENYYALRVGVQQPLFTGFRLRSNVRAAEYLAEAAALDYQSDESNVELQIQSAYWLLYQARETRSFIGENVRRTAAHLQDTERLATAGLATRNDYLRIEVQLANSRLAEIDATNDVRVAMMNLNKLLGRVLSTELVPGTLPGHRPGRELAGATEIGKMVSYAKSRRPEVLAFDSRLQANKATVTAAQGGWWPQIFFSGNWYYSRPNPRYLPTRDEFLNTWDVGVVLQFDLWNWGATSHQVEQAQAQLGRSQALFDLLKANIEVEVTQSQLRLQQSERKIEVAEKAVRSAEENARSINDKYKNGLATSSDVVDAEVALLQSQTSLSGALVEHQLSLARLKKAVGNDWQGIDE